MHAQPPCGDGRLQIRHRLEGSALRTGTRDRGTEHAPWVIAMQILSSTPHGVWSGFVRSALLLAVVTCIVVRGGAWPQLLSPCSTAWGHKRSWADVAVTLTTEIRGPAAAMARLVAQPLPCEEKIPLW